MPEVTPKGYPYPIGTDRVADGDDAIHDLADAVDTKLGLACSGIVQMPGAVTTTETIAVTFPAGLFTLPPNVVTSTASSDPAARTAAVTGVSTAGATICGKKTAGGAYGVYWHASQ